MELSGYEQEAFEAIEDFFRKPEDSFIGRVSRSLFKPVEVLSERLIPDKILEVAGNGVEGVLHGISHFTDHTVNVDRILVETREHAEVDSLEQIRTLDLGVCDKVAVGVSQKHELLAALEGAGCGVGGLALIAADIPLLFGVSMRVVRQLGACYGVDPFSPGEGVIAFKVFELACGGTRNRYSQLLEIEALKDELDGLEPQRRAEKAAVLTSMIVTKQVVGLLLSRKLLQIVPIAGPVVGAGFNYLFVQDVGETARQVYRRRFLQDKLAR